MAVKRYNANTSTWEVYAGYGTSSATGTSGSVFNNIYASGTASVDDGITTASSITAASFIGGIYYGDGSNLTGVATTSGSTFGNISASGTASINTLSVYGNVNASARMTSSAVTTGIISASGDITALSTITSSNTISTSSNININGVTIGLGGINLLSNRITNMVFGASAGLSGITGGQNNIAIGYQALRGHLVPGPGISENIAIGASAIYFPADDGTFAGLNYNVAIGTRALMSVGFAQDGNGRYNTAIGYYSQVSTTRSNYNVSVGASSLPIAVATQYNTAIGSLAGNKLTTGSYNTFIGPRAGSSLRSGSYNTIIGGDTGTFFGFTASSNAVILSDGFGYIVLSSLTNNSSSPITTIWGSASVVNGLTTASLISAASFSGAHYGTASFTSLTVSGTASIAGRITASAFVGDGSGITGLTTASSFTNIYASGTASIIGGLTTGSSINAASLVGGNLYGTYYGDGSNLTGVAATASIVGNTQLLPTPTNQPATPNLMEYGGNASVLYLTGATASSRGVIPRLQIISSSANNSNTSSTGGAVQNWIAGDTGASTGSTTINNLSSVYLEGGIAYKFKGILHLARSVGATNHSIYVQMYHPASATSIIQYFAQGYTQTGSTANTVQGVHIYSFSSGSSVTALSTSTTENNSILVDGIVRVPTSGWLTPRFAYSVGPGGTPTVLQGTYFEAMPIGASWSTNSYEGL